MIKEEEHTHTPIILLPTEAKREKTEMRKDFKKWLKEAQSDG